MLRDYQNKIVNDLQSGDCVVFLDTNVLAWSFRLNDVALRELMQWLDNIAHDERLVIPAWTVHEYNHHLLRWDPQFFLPHKTIGDQLKTNLNGLDEVAHLLVDDALARRLDHRTRDDLLSALTSSTDFIRRLVGVLGRQDDDRRTRLVSTWEAIINRAALKGDLHKLAVAAAADATGRYANRLSPGFKDAGKAENANGDLVIWREILECCSSRRSPKAVLVTNDHKSDWVYTPRSIVLPNGKTVDGSSKGIPAVKLPKPDLAAEFALSTGGGDLQVLSIAAVIDALSSDELNRRDAQEFRNLALAIKVDLARTPTGAVVQWFLKNRDAYDEAIHGVCNWSQSPSEVDQSAFANWTVAKMTAAKENVIATEVRWGDVFCELFL